MTIPKVLLIYTGGTIVMIEDTIVKSLKPFDFNQITNEIPELIKLNCQIDAVAFENPIDSSNINFEIWTKIGDNIFRNYNENFSDRGSSR